MNLASRKLGFHLIEILIVLTILSIISQWALSNYQCFIASEKRREAEVALLHLATSLEDYAIEYSNYTGVNFAKLHINPLIAKNRYVLEIKYANENHYSIVAKPLHHQASIDKACGSLILTSEGEKSVSGSNSWQACWS